jgi:hypothetical protein
MPHFVGQFPLLAALAGTGSESDLSANEAGQEFFSCIKFAILID